jgi:predicted Zn finger-like uncharacterized protein
MDVRCEKCLTVYDFDDSQVGASGVTVKCTQCGNLFKVKRRENTGELPLGAALARGNASPSPPPPKPSPSSSPAAPPVDELRAASATSWAVRIAATGEIFRFREMTTLQQWIVERKVVREDQISRDERTWKPLGGIPELEPFFRTVAQAMSLEAPPSLPVADFDAIPPTPTAKALTLPPAPPPSFSPPSPPSPPSPSSPSSRLSPPSAFAPTVPPPPRACREPTGPHSLGTPASVVASAPSGPIALGDAPRGGSGPVAMGSAKLPLPSVVDELASTPDDDDDELAPARRRPKWLFIAVPVGLVLASAAVVVGLGGKKMFGGAGATGAGGKKSAVLVDAGFEKLRGDGDDAFRQAIDLFTQARAADPEDARALAGLAEAKATWAFYLREDARLLDAQGAPAQAVAQTLRKQAQAYLDEGKRAATDALAHAPDAPEVNRAMGDLLRVDGAPAGEVERYLKRSLDKAPSDPEATYVMGALLLREGKSDDAKARLEQANTLEQALRKQPLLRATYLLAKIAQAAGQRDEAKRLVTSILAVNPQHERAKALAAQLDAAAPAPTPPAAPPPATAPAATAAPSTPAAPSPSAQAPSPSPSVLPSPPSSTADSAPAGDYNKIVAQADRLLENGRTEQARKLYEKALVGRPDGVEAMTGLGYCDLDRERFLAAVDHFKRALQIAPEFGEALIGLAESYKVRGEKGQALDYYRRYLKAQPNGPRAAMAQKNVRELEARGATSAPATTTTTTTTESPAAATGGGESGEPGKGDEAPRALPRPPPSDQPPP